ncbi:STE20-related kinase adapter protein beta [Fukomys damarensis]|uniref:STE20-related kinase adapter protein beta n=1 Tax=Fukomys damarensis TaxID=885580 RepID=A0A091E145_FUKDA|nr:STE20-related kinase adapter protein beta [Fukomys damarensis]
MDRPRPPPSSRWRSSLRLSVRTQKPWSRAGLQRVQSGASPDSLPDPLRPGRGFDNLTSVHLARHIPTGTLVTIKITNLENLTEERLKALQMLLQKLKGPPYSPVDLSIFPQSDSRMKTSLSGVDSGIGESVLVSSGTHTVNSDRLHTPSSKTFSPAFFSLVQLCLQQDPEKRGPGSCLAQKRTTLWYVLCSAAAGNPQRKAVNRADHLSSPFLRRLRLRRRRMACGPRAPPITRSPRDLGSSCPVPHV